MNAFDHIVVGLENLVPSNPNKIKITESQLENFIKEFVFEKLKGKSLAEAFCEKFNVKADFVLKIQVTDKTALDYIKRYYLL